MARKLRSLATADVPVRAVMYPEVDCWFPVQKGWVTGCSLQPPESLLPDGIWLPADLFWRLPPKKALLPQVPFSAAGLAAKLESLACSKPGATVCMYAMVDAQIPGWREPEVGEVDGMCFDRLLRPNRHRSRVEICDRYPNHRKWK